MQDHTAFTLRDEYAGTVQPVNDDGDPIGDPIPAYQGGTLALPPDSRSYDVAEKLAGGDGTIVVSTANAPLVDLLRNYPPLKEVAVPAGWNGADDLDDLSKAMLQDEAERLDIPRSGTKPELIDRIKTERARLAAADFTDDDDGNDDQGDPRS